MKKYRKNGQQFMTDYGFWTKTVKTQQQSKEQHQKIPPRPGNPTRDLWHYSPMRYMKAIKLTE